VSIELKQKGIIELKQKANFAIGMNRLTGIKAQVILVLDISKSMNKLYRSGAVQNVIERILGLALNFDDDGNIDMMLFGTNAYTLPPVTINDFDGYVERVILANHKVIEATNYAPPLKLILEKYRAHTGMPVFVIFLTDGGNSDKKETESVMRSLSSLPVFIQFVGIGAEDFPFLKKLDELQGRVLDNAGFMHIMDIENISDSELYSRLLNEFPDWIKKAKDAKILNAV